MIYENALIKYTNGKIARILYIDNLAQVSILISMDVNRWPYINKIEQLEKDLKQECASILEGDDYTPLIIEEEIKPLELQKRDEIWEVVQYVLSNKLEEKNLYISKYRTPVIKEAATRYDISENTIKNYLIRFWKGGKTKNSLLPKYLNCGGRGKERSISANKRGRPIIIGTNTGVNVDNNMKKIFKTGLNKYYYNDRRNSIKTTYELIIKDYFVKDYAIQNGVKVPILEDSSKIPTYHQFYYWFKKFNDSKKEVMKRQGDRIYYQNYRSIIGNSITDAEFGPGSLYQIDSTIADIYLVSSLDRNLIISRPVLYFVIDVYSRGIVGVHVTLESFNSYTGAMMALINSMTSKKEYCSKYGIDIDEEEWPNAIPLRILADRGELVNGQIEQAIENLGIIIQNSPPYRADYKGIIERSFGSINLKLKPFVDGAVTNGINKVGRGEKDYRLQANLTLKEFTKIVIKCVLFHNNHHVLSNYIIDDMVVEESIEKIPIKIWKYGIENKKGMLRKFPENIIKLNLLPREEATVSSRGVAFKKMLYACEYALKDGWFQKARSSGSWKIKVAYDPRDLTNIYVLDEEGRNYKTLSLLEHLSKYKGLSMDEYDEFQQHEKEMETKSKEKELQHKIKLYGEIEEIVGKAREKAEIQKDDTLSKSQRLKGITENNKIEKELYKEAIVIGEESKNIISEGTIEKEYDEFDIFTQIQEEIR
ncbi:MAG: Mu transposase C-terminal domain-containing protein [Anaeromicrobium sp.]|jgi:hypothetical protein|uniref:transposase n=1 Tax=Anaeromicrobium sp. TaxID=1929132 RepID=UPI0025F5ADBF|nr:transposase [Anaeromicrobium sp.]MCT4596027.1 Mu transposase C-terminal domain-containing protein [Anaeromicrobium sp.]